MEELGGKTLSQTVHEIFVDDDDVPSTSNPMSLKTNNIHPMIFVNDNEVPSTSKDIRLKSKSKETIASSTSSEYSHSQKLSSKSIRSRSSKFEQQLSTKLRNSRKTEAKHAGKRLGKRGKKQEKDRRSSRQKRRSSTDKKSCPVSSLKKEINRFNLKCKHCGRHTSGKLKFLPKATETKIKTRRVQKQDAKGAVTGAARDDKTTAAPVHSQSHEICWCEITPHILHYAMCSLLKGRHSVDLETLIIFIARNYPVNPEPMELLIELIEKLRVATLCGNVVQVSSNAWKLPDSLHNKRLTNNHVSRFWTMYANTMTRVHSAETNTRTLRPDVDQQTEEMPDYIS